MLNNTIKWKLELQWMGEWQLLIRKMDMQRHASICLCFLQQEYYIFIFGNEDLLIRLCFSISHLTQCITLWKSKWRRSYFFKTSGSGVTALIRIDTNSGSSAYWQRLLTWMTSKHLLLALLSFENCWGYLRIECIILTLKEVWGSLNFMPGRWHWPGQCIDGNFWSDMCLCW